MIETNPEIIEKTEKKLRNKYGVLMLTSALLSTAFGLFGFIASIMGAAQYEDTALAGLISVLLITDAILASICVITSGAFRKSIKPKKVSKKVQNATKGFLVIGGIVMALEGNVSGVVNALNGLGNNAEVRHYEPNRFLLVMMCILDGFGVVTAALVLPSYTGMTTGFWLNLLLSIVILAAFVFTFLAVRTSKDWENWTCYHTIDRKEANAEWKRKMDEEHKRNRERIEAQQKAGMKKAEVIKSIIVAGNDGDFDRLLTAAKDYFAAYDEVVQRAWKHPQCWLFHSTYADGSRTFDDMLTLFIKETGQITTVPWGSEQCNVLLSEAEEIKNINTLPSSTE